MRKDPFSRNFGCSQLLTTYKRSATLELLSNNYGKPDNLFPAKFSLAKSIFFRAVTFKQYRVFIYILSKSDSTNNANYVLQNGYRCKT